MHRFAQCTEIWKKFQNSVIHTSRNHNDEIAEVSPSLFYKLSLLYGPIIQQLISYNIELKFLFELPFISLKLSTHNLQSGLFKLFSI